MNKKAYIILVLTIFILGMVLFLIFRNEDDDAVPVDDPPSFPLGEEGGGLASRKGAFDYLNDEDTLDLIKNEPLTLAKIVDAPVAGYVIFEKEISTSTTETVVRFTEMGTGHIFELNLDQASSQRISNTTIPKTKEAVWSSDGSFVLMRYEAEDGEYLRNFLAGINDAQREGIELRGDFLPDGIENPIFAPSTNDLFYVMPNLGGAEGLVYDANSKNIDIVFSSPVKEWLASWIDEGNILITTQPSVRFAGITYRVSVNSGNFSKIVGPLNGLSATLLPQGEIFFTTSINNGLSSRFKSEDGIESIEINTLAEKCLATGNRLLCAVPNVLPQAEYPDAWYQGRVSFEDSIWSVGPGNVVKFYASLDLSGETVDATDLSISDDEELLLFKNKKDHSLWLLNIQDPAI